MRSGRRAACSPPGVECGNLDLDFGTTPNIYATRAGRKVVSVGQKSGVVHFFDADDDGADRQGAARRPLARRRHGRLGRLRRRGAVRPAHRSAATSGRSTPAPAGRRWVTPVADGVHWGPPVTAANGVLYTVDLKGFLDVVRRRRPARRCCTCR